VELVDLALPLLCHFLLQLSIELPHRKLHSVPIEHYSEVSFASPAVSHRHIKLSQTAANNMSRDIALRTTAISKVSCHESTCAGQRATAHRRPSMGKTYQ
jgi:hypothetical protein